jgi:Tol biopolymer transport system component
VGWFRAFTPGQQHGTAARGLFVADANGRHAHRISKIAAISPTWSPDGSRLAFIWNGVVVLRADGSHVHHLPIQGSEMQVAWSSRNQLLISHILDSPLLELARPDGTGLRTLRRGRPDEAFVNPKCSPDGRRIIYEALDRVCRQQMQRQRRGRRAPDWSPSGTRIAYATADGSEASGTD